MTRDYSWQISQGGNPPGTNAQVQVELDGVASVVSLQVRNSSPFTINVFSGQGTNAYLFTIQPYENSTTFLGTNYLQLTLQFIGSATVASAVLATTTDQALTSQTSQITIPPASVIPFTLFTNTSNPFGGTGNPGDSITLQGSPFFINGFSAGQTIYLTNLTVNGVDLQRLFYYLICRNIGGTTQSLYQRKDCSIPFTKAWPIFTFSTHSTDQHLNIQIVAGESYLSPLTPIVFAAGYLQ